MLLAMIPVLVIANRFLGEAISVDVL